MEPSPGRCWPLNAGGYSASADRRPSRRPYRDAADIALLRRTSGVPVIEAYGMTEATDQMASNGVPPRSRKPKEALLQAAGIGLAVNPRLVELPPAGSSPHPIAMPGVLGRPADWWVGPLAIDGYVAAVATDAPEPRPRVQWLDQTS
jgi:hypothetical protein